MNKLARSAIELLVKDQEQIKANALKLQELRTAIDAGAFSGRGADSEDVFDRLNVSIGSNAATADIQNTHPNGGYAGHD